VRPLRPPEKSRETATDSGHRVATPGGYPAHTGCPEYRTNTEARRPRTTAGRSYIQPGNHSVNTGNLEVNSSGWSSPGSYRATAGERSSPRNLTPDPFTPGCVDRDFRSPNLSDLILFKQALILEASGFDRAGITEYLRGGRCRGHPSTPNREKSTHHEVETRPQRTTAAFAAHHQADHHHLPGHCRSTARRRPRRQTPGPGDFTRPE
jgi:hypothetical protein